MPMTILAVGRIASPLKEAALDYESRLTRYDKVLLMELPDQREPSALSAAIIEQLKQKEGAVILDHLKPGDHVIALCIEAVKVSSEAFAQRLAELRLKSKPLVFVIGGSHGLSQAVLSRADERLSLSGLTMPHQLARVVLLEQLYRACKILSHERYHK
jgi:23S rRNA (pseudouridine1915-N3)-methyltransferase